MLYPRRRVRSWIGSDPGSDVTGAALLACNRRRALGDEGLQVQAKRCGIEAGGGLGLGVGEAAALAQQGHEAGGGVAKFLGAPSPSSARRIRAGLVPGVPRGGLCISLIVNNRGVRLHAGCSTKRSSRTAVHRGAGEFGDQGIEEVGGGGSGGDKLGFQLVHQGHQVIHFGHDAALFGQGWECHFETAQNIEMKMLHADTPDVPNG